MVLTWNLYLSLRITGTDCKYKEREMRHHQEVEGWRMTGRYLRECLLWAWRFITQNPLQESTYWLCFLECCQWTAFSSQPLRGGCCLTQAHTHGQHPGTDQDGSIATWLFLPPTGWLWWAIAVLDSLWGPLTQSNMHLNCTFCLMLLPSSPFHTYWSQRHSLRNTLNPKLHLKSASYNTHAAIASIPNVSFYKWILSLSYIVSWAVIDFISLSSIQPVQLFTRGANEKLKSLWNKGIKWLTNP